MLIVILFLLGLCLGSFINALVWRIHEQANSKKQNIKAKKVENLSILSGRSQCTNCGHQLAAKDLIPVLSWLILRGRCRYCGKPISRQYPAVELATAVWFGLSYVFWPGGVYGVGEWILLTSWLTASVGLIALAVYDFRWQQLPNKILYPALIAALAGRLAYILVLAPHKAHSFGLLSLSLLVASGLFWLIFTVSGGKWIGYGDVRLGLVTGTILASPAKSLLMIFLASIIGTLFVAPALVSGRKQLASKIPFGPFLILATAISLLFGDSLINLYKNLL
jgi:leader peptidase (prepilin peptidase)/N-methyltransferase